MSNSRAKGLKSSSSFLRPLPRLPLTSIPPFIFPLITLVEGSFYAKFWPIQLAFRLLISCRIFLCFSNLNNTTSLLTWSVQLIFSILLQHNICVTQNKYEYDQILISYFFNKFRSKWTAFDWHKSLHYKYSTQIPDGGLTLSCFWAQRCCGADPNPTSLQTRSSLFYYQMPSVFCNKIIRTRYT